MDPDGHQERMMVSIVDHKHGGDAMRKVQGAYKITSGQKQLWRTTAGWKLPIEWNDGSKQYTDLKVLKESNPVQAAEYTLSRGIKDEPAFDWWVPYMLQKQDTIIDAVNTHVNRKSHTYGIKVLTSINRIPGMAAYVRPLFN